MTAAAAILTTDLEKRFVTGNDVEVQALRGVNLAIAAGEIYALLGPNGAGKTTTISILTTLMLPSGGSARVAGYDVVNQPAEVRRRIGITFQEVVLDGDLSGRQVLDFHGRLYGLSKRARAQRIENLAALVELSDVLERSAATYSGGMKRRLELARGLMTTPEVLFLDEPTQGLDPQNRVGIWRYVQRMRDELGITLLLTTHYMEEAETLADRVGIIDAGRLVTEGRPAELVRAMGADVVAMLGTGDVDRLVGVLATQPYVSRTVRHDRDVGRLLQIGVDSGDRRLAELVRLAAANEFQVHEVSVARPTLGDVFLAHTGYALRDDS